MRNGSNCKKDGCRNDTPLGTKRGRTKVSDLAEIKAMFPNASPDFLTGVAKEFGLPDAPTTTPTTSTRNGKYNAIPTIYNGATYPSKAEARKAQELDLMVKAGEIDFYLRQVPFLLPGNITYRADFVTFTGDKASNIKMPDSCQFVVTVIEVKGFSTPSWRMKYKLFKASYPNLSIEIVK